MPGEPGEESRELLPQRPDPASSMISLSMALFRDMKYASPAARISDGSRNAHVPKTDLKNERVIVVAATGARQKVRRRARARPALSCGRGLCCRRP